MSLSLSRRLKDDIIIDDKTYKVNAAFDNILRLFDLVNSKEPNEIKIKIAIQMLFGEKTDLLKLELETLKTIVDATLEEYTKSKEEIEYDDLGNEMPTPKRKQLISLEHDAEYIFGGFVQAYGIDLEEAQGILHWYKFRSLLASLPNDTRIREIMGYRAYRKQGKNDTHHAQMMKLQEQFKLPGADDYEDDEELDELEGGDDFG